MSILDDFRAALHPIRSEIEERYPLTLGRITQAPLDGDDGWHVDFRIAADRHGPMSLLDLCGLEEWIRERTGFGVLIDTQSEADREVNAHPRAAAE
ncbi:MAG TPA: hypothetical protein VHL98_16285 [Microvirga sp.]|jgi:hypothetical protein|nr:hypothetical protein [Microvirga sp.]